MSAASRMVLANLAMEMGAKAAFTPMDEVLVDTVWATMASCCAVKRT